MGGVDRCCQYGLNLEVTADPLFGNRGQGGELESKRESALLVLADGEVFEGEAVGARAPGGVTTGELVFNTVLSGYQEVVTDPSYAGQVVAFTCPHIGNYGVNPSDAEAGRPWCRGIVVRELSARPSSWRATGSLESFLVENRVPGISGIDTRRLTRHLREDGAMGCAFGTADESEPRAAAAAEPGTTGQDFVTEVTTKEPYERGTGRVRVVAYDFGVKETMLRSLGELATVTVVPAWYPVARTLELDPDGVFLSNGPGDPAALKAIAETVRGALGQGAGVRHLPRPPAARSGAGVRGPSRSPLAIMAATIRFVAFRPGRWRSPARTTTMPSTCIASRLGGRSRRGSPT